MDKFLKRIISFVTKISPKMEVAGLEINEAYINFRNLGKSTSNQVSLRLAPGTVVDGKVVNQEALTVSLRELHKQLTRKNKQGVSVILSLPANNVYVQPFTLPAVAVDNLAESAELNMRMISPIDVKNAYFDWQRIEGGSSGDQVDMVGAFVMKDIADAFMDAVIGAGFNIAAVEFSTLSLVRAALSVGLLRADEPELLIQVGTGGISYIISHRGSLYFQYFTSWERYREGDKTIAEAKMRTGILDEVRKLINFYSTSVKTGEVKSLLIVGGEYTAKIKEFIAADFASLEVVTATPENVDPAVGAALRGQTPRSQDFSISLTSFNAVEVFRKNQLVNFVAIWRNVLFTTFGFLLAVFFTSAILLRQIAFGVASEDPFKNDTQNSAELVQLEGQAEDFNRLVTSLEGINKERKDAYTIIQDISSLMGSRITVRRTMVNLQTGQVLVSGTGISEAEVTDFKNRVSGAGDKYKDVELPLAEIRVLGNGNAEFTLRFNLVG